MCIVTAEPRAAQRRRNRRHPPRSIHQGLFTFSRAIFFQNSNLFLIIAWTELLAVRDDESRCFVRPFRRHFRQLEFPLFLPGRRNLMIHERYLTRWVGKPSVPIGFGYPSHSGTIKIKWKYANVTTATGTRRLRRSPFAWIRPATDCFLRNRRKGRASRFISPKTLSISIALRTTVTSTRGKMKLQVGFQVENHL